MTTCDKDNDKFAAAWEAFVSTACVHFKASDRHLAYVFYLRGCIDGQQGAEEMVRSELAKLGV
jgi:hypothetical protein